MHYSGPLYGLHAGTYFPMILTAADVDQLQRDLEESRAALRSANQTICNLNTEAGNGGGPIPPSPADASLFGQAP